MAGPHEGGGWQGQSLDRLQEQSAPHDGAHAQVIRGCADAGVEREQYSNEAHTGTNAPRAGVARDLVACASAKVVNHGEDRWGITSGSAALPTDIHWEVKMIA